MEQKELENQLAEENTKVAETVKDSDKIKIVVLRRLGFRDDDVAVRFGLSTLKVKEILKTFKPTEKNIKYMTEIVLRNISAELSTGFTDELKAIDDIFYWAINKLRARVMFDNNIPVKELTDIVKTAYSMREGNPLDKEINNFFLAVNNQTIVNMAKGDGKKVVEG